MQELAVNFDPTHAANQDLDRHGTEHYDSAQQRIDAVLTAQTPEKWGTRGTPADMQRRYSTFLADLSGHVKYLRDRLDYFTNSMHTSLQKINEQDGEVAEAEEMLADALRSPLSWQPAVPQTVSGGGEASTPLDAPPSNGYAEAKVQFPEK